MNERVSKISKLNEIVMYENRLNRQFKEHGIELYFELCLSHNCR